MKFICLLRYLFLKDKHLNRNEINNSILNKFIEIKMNPVYIQMQSFKFKWDQVIVLHYWYWWIFYTFFVLIQNVKLFRFVFVVEFKKVIWFWLWKVKYDLFLCFESDFENIVYISFPEWKLKTNCIFPFVVEYSWGCIKSSDNS